MIRFDLWSPYLEHRAALSDYDNVELTLRHNAIGQATVELPATSWRVKHLIARGARLTADLHLGDEKYRRIFSGRLVEAIGEGMSNDSAWTATFESDIALLWGMLCYPNPASPASDQSLQQYDTQSGPFETVFKHYVSANAGRFVGAGLPTITVAPNLGRGGNVADPIKARMVSVGELLATAADTAGLGLWVVQRDNDLLVDVYQTRNHPYQLSEVGGTVTGWKLTTAAPTATRVIVAGGGTSTARSFLEVRPHSDQHHAWGRRIEVYDESGGSGEADMRKAALERLTDSAPKWGVSVNIADGPNFQVGRNVWLGDKVTVELSDIDTATEPLREVILTSDMGIGPDGFPAFSVRPTVGETTGGSTRLYQLVTRLARKKGRA